VRRWRASGSDGDGDASALLDKKQSTALALGLAEKRDRAEEEQGETVDIDPRLLPSTLAPARFLGLCCPGKAMVSSVEIREEREWSEGANGQQGMAPEGARGFNRLAWSWCRVHLDGGDWARVAVFLVWHCEPSLALGLARSGVQCLLAAASVSVRVRAFRCVARRAGLARVSGVLRVVLGARCRARPCAEQRESVRVCTGTRMPVSTCQGGTERVQDRAMAWPMGALGGRAQLVELGGGEWGLVAQCRPVASPRSFRATVVLSGYAGE
jgi:hypothetical protein